MIIDENNPSRTQTEKEKHYQLIRKLNDDSVLHQDKDEPSSGDEDENKLAGGKLHQPGIQKHKNVSQYIINQTSANAIDDSNV